MDANELRAAFTRFFTDRGHTAVPSASLIPHDPSVLFTIAGMVPFKPYFVGDEQAPWPRATSVQKCFRTLDIEIVGTDTYHCTFFEMLGNFSFGDYFKEDAIPMAWELLTEVFGLDGDRLWVTVHDSDDEAEQIWIDKVGLPGPNGSSDGRRRQLLGHGRHRSLRPGLGDLHRQGPRATARAAGPSSGTRTATSSCGTWSSCSSTRRPTAPGPSCPRRTSTPGPASSGSCPSCRGTTRCSTPTCSHRSSRRPPPRSGPPTVATRRPTSPCGSWPITAGPWPCWWPTASSRPTRGGATSCAASSAGPSWRPGGSGSRTLVTPVLVKAATDVLGGAWPALVENNDVILSVLEREEAGFDRTLRAGLGRLEEAFATGDKVLGGDVAFTLHDTHGFPVELTEELARDAGVEVDRAGFDAAMTAQRARARAAARASKVGDESAYRSLLEIEGTTHFVGRVARRTTRCRPRVVAVMAGGGDGGGDDGGDGDVVEIFLDQTPFYAEGGGQVGDTGTIVTETGRAEVYDTVYALPGLIAHKARVSGELVAGQDALASIDVARREAIRRNHTATHLLHAALRTVLGDHVRQQGSLVAPDRLRFDFSHHGQPTPEELEEVFDLANAAVLTDAPVQTTETSLAGGRAHGRAALLRGQVRRDGAGHPGRRHVAGVLRRYPRRLARADRARSRWCPKRASGRTSGASSP